MNHKATIVTIVGFFIATSFCDASHCPHNDEVTIKLEELAKNGTATFNNDIYHLIGPDKTSIFYRGKLLENDTQLNGFLKLTKLIDRKLLKAEAHHLDLLPTPNFCAYKITIGENSEVIALLADSG